MLILWYPEFTVDLTSPTGFARMLRMWHQEYVHTTNLSSKPSARQVTQCRIVLYKLYIRNYKQVPQKKILAKARV